MPVSVRIEASLELPHRLDARIAGEHPQQFLFDRVASDSVFRQRTSSHCNDQSGQLDQHLASSCQLIVSEGNDIGVNVAIGDVPQTARSRRASSHRRRHAHHLGKSIGRHDHVGGGFGNPAVGLSTTPRGD